MDRKRILAFSIGPLLGAALSFVTLPLLAWYYPPEDVGRNNIFQIFNSFALLLCVLGLDQAYVREFHESADRRSLLRNCALPGFLILLIGIVSSLPLSGVFSMLLYGENHPIWYQATAACVVLTFVIRFLSLVLRMQERGLAYSASQVIPKLIVIALLTAYSVFGMLPSYGSLLFANFISLFLVAIVFTWNAREELRLFNSLKIDRDQLKSLLKFGVPLIGAGLAYWGLSATSVIALRSYSGFSELGIYSLGMSFAGAATIFQSIFTTVWIPTVYKWVAEKKDLNRIDDVIDHVAVAVCLIFVLTGLLAWLIDYILPRGYGDVRWIIVCCMAQPLLYTLSESTVVGLNVQRKTYLSLLISVFSLICNLLLGVLLVPKFGAAGAASSNAIAYFVFFVLRTEMASRSWRRIKRKSIYPVVSMIIAVSILLAIFKDDFPVNQYVLWLSLLLIIFFHHRKLFLVRLARNPLQSDV